MSSTRTAAEHAPGQGADAFSDERWWAMCSANMSVPVPLHLADVSQPFVYDRQYGLFYVPVGHHQLAMSTLLAWQHGCVKGLDVAEKLGLEFSDGTADRWLETTSGAAFRSSQGKKVQAGKRGALTVIERRLLGDVEYVF